MKKDFQTSAPARQATGDADPTCLLWGFNAGQLQFLSQVLGVSSIHFTTQLSPTGASLSTVISPTSANLTWLAYPLPIVRTDFLLSPPPLPQRSFTPPGGALQPPGVFHLPSQVGAFLSQVDQYCYPPRGRILNIFGLQPKSGSSTIAFGLASSAKNSIFVDASCPFSDSISPQYSSGLRKLGFPAISNFSSRDLEADLLVSRLREVLPGVQNTRFLQLHRGDPRQLSPLFSLLVRAFSLVVIDWGQLGSVQDLNNLPGQILVVRDYSQSAVNRQVLQQIHQRRILLVTNRVPNRIVSPSSDNQRYFVPHCRELKRLQAQGLGSLWPKSLQARLAELLRNTMAAAA